MNSLPFISHHLFVAAVGSQGRVPERPMRRERLSAEPVDRTRAITLEVMESQEPMPEDLAREARARLLHGDV